MTEWANPYQTLGLTRGATMDDVRAAYHAAALKYHPDRCRGDTHARQQFQRIVEAYHTIIRWRFEEDSHTPAPASPAPAHPSRFGGRWGLVESALPMGPGSRRLQRPTRNEPRLFLVLWLLALAAGAAVEWLVVSILPDRLPGDDESLLAVAALVVAPLAAYAAVFAAAVAVPVMTRQVVYLVLRFTQGLQKALPSTRSGDLPRGPKARLK